MTKRRSATGLSDVIWYYAFLLEIIQPEGYLALFNLDISKSILQLVDNKHTALETHLEIESVDEVAGWVSVGGGPGRRMSATVCLVSPATSACHPRALGQKSSPIFRFLKLC